MLPLPQLKMVVYISLVLIVLSTARFCRAEASDSQQEGILGEVRHKRGPTVGLFAFPRVGRADPDLLETWGDVEQLADDYEDYPMRGDMVKRQGKLVAFPRVGRSGSGPLAGNGPSNLVRYWPSSAGLQKRAGNSGANSGMWFGPRLGKRANLASTEIKGEQL